MFGSLEPLASQRLEVYGWQVHCRRRVGRSLVDDCRLRILVNPFDPTAHSSLDCAPLPATIGSRLSVLSFFWKFAHVHGDVLGGCRDQRQLDLQCAKLDEAIGHVEDRTQRSLRRNTQQKQRASLRHLRAECVAKIASDAKGKSSKPQGPALAVLLSW